jgi:hypothetical protein
MSRNPNKRMTGLQRAAIGLPTYRIKRVMPFASLRKAGFGARTAHLIAKDWKCSHAAFMSFVRLDENEARDRDIDIMRDCFAAYERENADGTMTVVQFVVDHDSSPMWDSFGEEKNSRGGLSQKEAVRGVDYDQDGGKVYIPSQTYNELRQQAHILGMSRNDGHLFALARMAQELDEFDEFKSASPFGVVVTIYAGADDDMEEIASSSCWSFTNYPDEWSAALEVMDEAEQGARWALEAINEELAREFEASRPDMYGDA